MRTIKNNGLMPPESGGMGKWVIAPFVIGVVSAASEDVWQVLKSVVGWIFGGIL